jgi:hypothetical protein
MAAESILNTDILIRDRACICSFQKTSIPPPQRKLEVNPPTPFGCPNTFTIIRNNFVLKFPPPPDGRNFLRGGSVDLFWNDPFDFLVQKSSENLYFAPKGEAFASI